MALEPFRRKIGVPGAAPLVPVRTVAIPDIGRQIAGVGQAIFEAGEPERKQKAINAAEIAAGQQELRIDEDGNVIPLERPKGGGAIYNEVFDRIAEERYVNQTIYNFEKGLVEERAARLNPTDGKPPDRDPLNYRDWGEETAKGILDVAPPEFRGRLAEAFNRELLQRVSLFSEESIRQAQQDTAREIEFDRKDALKRLEDAYIAGDLFEIKTAGERYNAVANTMKQMASSQSALDLFEKEHDLIVGEGVKYLRAAENMTPFVAMVYGFGDNLGLNQDQITLLRQAIISPGLDTDLTLKLRGGKEIQLTGANIREHFGPMKQEMLATLANRSTQLNRIESEAAAAIREAAQLKKFDEVIAAIESTTNDGIYNYTNKERDNLDIAFDNTVNQSGGLNTESGRNAAIRFISRYAYMPGDMKGWFTSNLRNPDSWKSALNLYNSTKNLTTESGSTMGDVLVGSLLPKDKALFNAALRMQSAGVQDAVIGAQIKNILAGKAYTSSEAQVQYNATMGKDAYRKNKANYLKETFGVEGIPPKDLSQNYDEAFAANLAIYQNDIEEAERATVAQMQSLSVRNPIFFNGIGYKNVYNKIGGSPKAFNQILLNHLSTLTLPNGRKLLSEVMTGDGAIARHVVGGPNSTVKLIPLDGNVNEIGRYRVLIYNPGNLNRLEGEVVVDFGRDLNPQIQAYTRKQRADAAAADKAGIEAARKQREQEQKAYQKAVRERSTISGPKM